MNTYTDEQIKTKIENGENLLIDFYAEWCGPCKMLMPVLENIENDYSSVEFIKFNVDENPSFAIALGIKGVPTVLFYKEKELVHRFSGFQPKPYVEQKIIENYGN